MITLARGAMEGMMIQHVKNRFAYERLRKILLDERAMRDKVFNKPGKQIIRARKCAEIDDALQYLDALAAAAGVPTQSEQPVQPKLWE